jgi:hypothetical protein
VRRVTVLDIAAARSAATRYHPGETTLSLSEDLVRQVSRNRPEYQRRVYLEAAIYVLLNVTAIISIVIIVWQYRLFVTTAQRSNVETLTLAIIVILFAYLVLTTFKGFIGAIRIAYYHLPLGGGSARGAAGPPDEAPAGQPRMSAQERRVEERKQRALKPAKHEHSKAYFNIAFTAQDRPDEPIRVPIADDAGSLGELILDGVEARIEAEKKGVSNTLFEYVLNQLQDRLRQRQPEFEMQIVAWSSVDDEAAARYRSETQAFRALAQQLGKGPIWPTEELTADDVDHLRRAVRDVVPALRDEAFLPDVEYEAEYSIPIIPEPLGFISLKRQEQRADPVATMGCASLVTLTIMALLILFTIFPPWLPSR